MIMAFIHWEPSVNMVACVSGLLVTYKKLLLALQGTQLSPSSFEFVARHG